MYMYADVDTAKGFVLETEFPISHSSLLQIPSHAPKGPIPRLKPTASHLVVCSCAGV